MCKPNTRCLNCGEMFYKKPFRLKKENIHTCSRSCYGEYLHKLKIKEILIFSFTFPPENKKCADRSQRIKTQTSIVAKPI